MPRRRAALRCAAKIVADPGPSTGPTAASAAGTDWILRDPGASFGPAGVDDT
jgi:hypothetical protein